MIWNIFKKDVRLLWPFIAINLIVQLLFVFYAVRLAGQVDSFDYFWFLVRRQVLYFVRDAGMALPILLAVQQDAPLSVRQDWLTRPVAHKDLFFAKLLFALFAAQGPMLIANLVASLTMPEPVIIGSLMPAEPATGPLTAIGVLYDVLWTFVTVSLAIMTVASLTRSLRGALLVIGLLYAGLYGFDLMLQLLRSYDISLRPSDNDWMVAVAKYVTILCASALILSLQYFGRRTLRAIAFGVVFFLIYLGLPYLPWPSEFDVRAFSSPPAASATLVSLSYDANHAKFQDAGGSDPRLYIPLRVHGLARNFILTASDAEFRIVDANGAVLYRSHEGMPYFFRDGDSWVGQPEGGSGDIQTYDSFSVPAKIYAKYKTQLVHVEIDYSLIQLRKAGDGAIATENGKSEMPGLGTCMTGPDLRQPLRCFDPLANSHCVNIYAENPATGERNPSSEWCIPDLTPQALHWLGPASPDMISFAAAFRFPQAADAAEFPVKQAQVAQSRLVVTAYVPVAFIKREIESPSLHLSDLVGIETGKENYQQSLAENAAFRAGLGAFDRKAWDEVIADFSAVIQLDPKNADAFHNRGDAYLSQSNYDKAIADYDQAINLDPKDSDSFTNRGNAYSSKANYDKAVADYSQAIQLNPKDADALNDRCYVRALQNQSLEMDLADCNASLKLEPNYAYALSSRGLVYFRMGNYAQSIADYDVALQIEPKSAETLYQRGISKMRANNPSGGRADIAAALAMDPKAGDEITKAGIKP